MKCFIDHINIEDKYDAITIGDDLSIFLFNAQDTAKIPNEPQKLTHAAIVICTTGDCHMKVNLQEYEVESPMHIALMPVRSSRL